MAKTNTITGLTPMVYSYIDKRPVWQTPTKRSCTLLENRRFIFRRAGGESYDAGAATLQRTSSHQTRNKAAGNQIVSIF
jgi:hypothetical protein